MSVFQPENVKRVLQGRKELKKMVFQLFLRRV